MPAEAELLMKRLYYCYALEDGALCTQLESHAAVLKGEGHIKGWSRRQLKAGDDPIKVIDSELRQADIIVLLVSVALFNVEGDFEEELNRVMERHRRGRARLIPVLVRPVSLSAQVLAQQAFLPKDGVAVTSWSNRDEAWAHVISELRKILIADEKDEDDPPPERLVLQSLRRYLEPFLNEDPGLLAQDIHGLSTPFVDLNWDRRSPDQVERALDRQGLSGAQRRSRLVWWRKPAANPAAKSLEDLLIGSPTASSARRAPLPWVLHCGPGGGKTTTVLRALAALAQQCNEGRQQTRLPVYVRLAGLPRAMLLAALDRPPSAEALLEVIGEWARDADLLRALLRTRPGYSVGVVFDGLDEIADRALRERLVQWLLDGAPGFCRKHSMVLTCRTLDFPKRAGMQWPWRLGTRVRAQYMYLLPADADWSTAWVSARCSLNPTSLRWLNEQLIQLRQSILSDPRPTRADFIHTPFLLVGLCEWLLVNHTKDGGFKPLFPENNDALVQLVVQHCLDEAVAYSRSTIEGKRLAEQHWLALRAAVAAALCRLALALLRSPSEGWDVQEEAILRELKQAAGEQNLGAEHESAARLILDKSRLLSRVAGEGDEVLLRTFAHPLILFNLGAQQVACLLQNADDRPEVAEELSHVVGKAFSARCIPAALRLLQRPRIPRILITSLLQHLTASDLTQDLDALIPEDARAILFEAVAACPDDDLFAMGQAGGIHFACGLMNALEHQKEAASKQTLSAILRILESALARQAREDADSGEWAVEPMPEPTAHALSALYAPLEQADSLEDSGSASTEPSAVPLNPTTDVDEIVLEEKTAALHEPEDITYIHNLASHLSVIFPEKPRVWANAYAAQFASFAAYLREYATHERFARALVRFWELLLQIPSPIDIGSIKNSLVLEARLKAWPKSGKNWYLYASINYRSELEAIEASIYSRSAPSNRNDRESWGEKFKSVARYLILWLLLSAFFGFIGSLADRLGPRFYRWLGYMPSGSMWWMIFKCLILYLLFLLAITVASYGINLAGGFLRKGLTIWLHNSDREKIEIAMRDYKIETTELILLVKVFGKRPIIDRLEAMQRLALLAEVYSHGEKISSPPLRESTIEASRLITQQFQQLNYQQLLGVKRSQADQELDSQSSHEGALLDLRYGDAKRLWWGNVAALAVVAFAANPISLVQIANEWEPKSWPVALGLLTSLVLMGFMSRWYRPLLEQLTETAPPIKFPLVDHATLLVLVLAAAAQLQRRCAEWGSSLDNLRSDVAQVVSTRTQDLFVAGVVTLTPLLLAVLLCRVICSRGFLRIPRGSLFWVADFRFAISIALSSSIVLLIAARTLAVEQGGRLNSTAVLRAQTQKIRTGKEIEPVLTAVIPVFVDETNYIRYTRHADPISLGNGLQKATLEYLQALCERSKNDWELVQIALSKSSDRMTLPDIFNNMHTLGLLSESHIVNMQCLATHACRRGSILSSCKELNKVIYSWKHERVYASGGCDDLQSCLSLEMEALQAKQAEQEVAWFAEAWSDYLNGNSQGSYEKYKRLCWDLSSNSECATSMFELALSQDSPENALHLSNFALKKTGASLHAAMKILVGITHAFLDRKEDFKRSLSEASAEFRSATHYSQFHYSILRKSLAKLHHSNIDQVLDLLSQLDRRSANAKEVANVLDAFVKQLEARREQAK